MSVKLEVCICALMVECRVRRKLMNEIDIKARKKMGLESENLDQPPFCSKKPPNGWASDDFGPVL